MSTQHPRALAAYTQTDDDLPGDVSQLSETSENRHATVDHTTPLYQHPQFYNQRRVDELQPVLQNGTAGSGIEEAPDTQVVGRDSGPPQESSQTSHVEVNDSRISAAGNHYCSAGTPSKDG